MVLVVDGRILLDTVLNQSGLYGQVHHILVILPYELVRLVASAQSE